MNPTIPVDQSIYEQSSTQKARLGTRLPVGDRVFYYAQLSTSANGTAGNVVCSPPLIASHQAGIVNCAAATTGAKTVTVTMGTAMTVNAYAEGYISKATGAGMGTLYRIKSHPAIATAATGSITLYDAIPGTIAAGAVNFTPNLFKDVKVGSQVLDTPIGVLPIAVTTGNYFWLQTWGPAAPVHTAATPAAAAITLGTLGSVVAARSGTEGGGATITEIGKNLNLAATAAETNPVFLTILP